MRKYTFQNILISKKQLKQILSWTFTNYGSLKAAFLADELKYLGFNFSTKAGISISIEDLQIPVIKSLVLHKSNKEVLLTEDIYLKGHITEVERFQKIIDIWSSTSERLKDEVVSYFKNYDPLNSVYMMAFSGARGNLSQVRQLVGMRGLMSDPNGEIMDLPIKQNFREGLTITDYLMSGYGARKGIVDTALKTANSGYLTRRLIDIAQDIIIREKNCLSERSIIFNDVEKDSIEIRSHYARVLGRLLSKTTYYRNTTNILMKEGTELTPNYINLLRQNGILKISVRSPLTCRLNRSICQSCYGWDLSSENIVNLGDAVGIIAGQSIGEPGTQLTMRTFHTGGTFTGGSNQNIKSSVNGTLKFSKFLKTVSFRTNQGKNVIKTENSGILVLSTFTGKISKIEIPAETLLFVKNNAKIKRGQLLGQLTETNKQTKIETKTIISKLSGEIALNKSNLVWLLKGKLFTLPLNAYVNSNLTNRIFKDDYISRLKIINNRSGIVNIIKNKADLSEQIIQILSASVPYKDSKVYELFNYFRSNAYIFSIKRKVFLLNYPIINKDRSFRFKPKEKLARVLTNAYKSLVGGTPYFLNENHNSFLWIAEEVHPIDRDSSLLLVENNEFIPENYELIENTFSISSGVVSIVGKSDITQEIIIKPGSLYKSKRYKEYNQKVFYPGEIIFRNIQARQISLLQKNAQYSEPEILIRPVILYQVPRSNGLIASMKKSLVDNKIFSFKSSFITQLIDKQVVKANKSVELFEESIEVNLISKLELPDAFNIDIIGRINARKNLELTVSESLYLADYVPKNSKTLNNKISIIVENNQFVNNCSILGYVEAVAEEDIEIIKIKNRIERSNNLFVVRKQDCLISSSDDLQKKRVGDIVNSFGISKEAGKILLKRSGKWIIQSVYPYLFLKGAKLFCKDGDLIEKGERIGLLDFKKEITGDIVQGLPRVEEILEARKVKKNASPILITKTGLTSEYKFVKLGDCEGNKEDINPHELLSLYFGHYAKIESLYEATYRSVKKIQSLLLNLIQAVYQSQGVIIADKHLEVIIKQMTTKVRIYHSGNTTLFPGEIIDLHCINYINKALKNEKKQLAFYKPILLGITRASLSTESFVSAASFQETTKVLTKAAIEGKIDWLRGLKENVIIGRLIPAGTGFAKLINI